MAEPPPLPPPIPAQAIDPEYDRVLKEISRIQNAQANWGMAFLVLIGSISFFFWIGRSHSAWKGPSLFIVMGVLFVHEMGHFIAMKAFGYRNLRMFFIPLFGAAVTGKNYNVPGWKKAIVSLMGPAPGILLGVVLGIYGIAFHQLMLVRAALIAIFINGLNLLPILPFDGGWIMYAVLFSRHYVLDAVFRGVAGGVLILLAVSRGERIFTVLGIFILLTLPVSLRLSRVANELRAAGVPSASPDNQSIPPQTAVAIVKKLREKSTRGLNNKIIAQQTLQVFEMLNDRPPGIGITIGLIAAQAALIGLVLSLWLFGVAAVRRAHHVPTPAAPPVHQYESPSI